MAGAVLSVIDPQKLSLTSGQLHTFAAKLNGQRLPFIQFAKDSIFALPFGKDEVRVEFESVGDEKPLCH